MRDDTDSALLPSRPPPPPPPRAWPPPPLPLPYITDSELMSAPAEAPVIGPPRAKLPTLSPQPPPASEKEDGVSADVSLRPVLPAPPWPSAAGCCHCPENLRKRPPTGASI